MSERTATTRIATRLSLGRNPRGPSPLTLSLLGMLALGLLAAFLYVGFTAAKRLPFTGYYYVQAAFRNADNIGAQDQVRMGGVRVGQVDSTRVEHGVAIVRLQLAHSIAPLRSDTRLEIRPLSAVGTRFVEITPGTTGAPLTPGSLIPADHTSATVPLTSLFDVFDHRTQTRAQTLLQQLGVGFAGRGDDAGTALADLPPTLADTAAISSAIDAQGGLAPFVRSAESAAAAADPVRGSIAHGFGTEQLALRPFAEKASAVEATLAQAPATLRALTSQLPPAAQLLHQLESFSRAAIPALDTARGALIQTAALLTQSQPGLHAVPAAISLLRPATPPVLRLLNQLIEPALPHVSLALLAALPIVTELAPRGCDLHRFAANWASILSWGDSFSNYLRYDIVSPDETSVGGNPGARPGIYASPYPTPCQPDNQSVP
jgi:phospholipid/cholesterol/gamma-HCH transport system substrate-binding protein